MIPLSLHSTCNSYQREESPLHNCAPPFAFICASIQSLEREETFTITHSYAPFLQVFLYVFFTFSSVQYWAPTYGKTHCCTPPEVPPEEYKRVKEKKCQQTYIDNFVLKNIMSHKVLVSVKECRPFSEKVCLLSPLPNWRFSPTIIFFPQETPVFGEKNS